MLWVLETLKPSPSGTLPPLRGHSILSKQFYQLGRRTQTCGHHYHSNHHRHIYASCNEEKIPDLVYFSVIFWLYIVYLTFFFKFLFIFLCVFRLHWVCVSYACLVPTVSHHVGPLREQLVLGTLEPSPAPVYKLSYFSHCNSIAYDTLKLTFFFFFFLQPELMVSL